MSPIYEKLYGTYGESILREFGGYDEKEVLSQLDHFSLDKPARLRLEELFFAYYHQWSADAFSLGLHLGLSLLCDDVRRTRPQ